MARATILASLKLVGVALLLSTCCIAQVSAKDRDGLQPPADPFADPGHDVFNPLRYIASDILTGLGVGLYFVVTCVLAGMMWRYGARWMMCVIVGGYCMTFGLAMRFALARKPDSNAFYIIEYLFVVLSPCAFIAGDYILLGRLAQHLNAGQHLFIRPSRITKIFITSDVTTFLIQAAGGGLSTSHMPKTAIAGSHIFLAGLALQLASFFLFTSLYVVFLFKVRTREPAIWHESRTSGLGWLRDWRVLAGALALSCVGILIRSVYRTVELSQGYVGPLATNEATFYGLDTLPLLVAIGIYMIFWPGRFIDEDRVRRGNVSPSAPGTIAGDREVVDTAGSSLEEQREKEKAENLELSRRSDEP